MRPGRGEDGFTLIETIVVTAIVALVAGTLGTFFLAGASPAVAAADRDVAAALDEARRTAVAFDAATIVFVPAATGSGYRARVYARFPGDPGFAPRNGPSFDSTVAISETQSPLGAPGFALAIDSRGAVTGFPNFSPGQTAPNSRPCPAAGAFVLHLAYERQERTIAVPCAVPLSASPALVVETPGAAASPTPFPLQTCPPPFACVPAAPVPAPTPSPAASVALPATPPPAPPLPVVPPTPPAQSPTACPAFFTGSAPGCIAEIVEAYSAAADGYGAHTATLFADETICDDDGCSGNAIVWTWGCGFGGRSGSTGSDGSNAPYQPYGLFGGSAGSMIGIADHDAAEANGDGVVTTEDSYCAGYVLPNP